MVSMDEEENTKIFFLCSVDSKEINSYKFSIIFYDELNYYEQILIRTNIQDGLIIGIFNYKNITIKERNYNKFSIILNKNDKNFFYSDKLEFTKNKLNFIYNLTFHSKFTKNISLIEQYNTFFNYIDRSSNVFGIDGNKYLDLEELNRSFIDYILVTENIESKIILFAIPKILSIKDKKSLQELFKSSILINTMITMISINDDLAEYKNIFYQIQSDSFLNYYSDYSYEFTSNYIKLMLFYNLKTKNYQKLLLLFKTHSKYVQYLLGENYNYKFINKEDFYSITYILKNNDLISKELILFLLNSLINKRDQIDIIFQENLNIRKLLKNDDKNLEDKLDINDILKSIFITSEPEIISYFIETFKKVILENIQDNYFRELFTFDREEIIICLINNISAPRNLKKIEMIIKKLNINTNKILETFKKKIKLLIRRLNYNSNNPKEYINEIFTFLSLFRKILSENISDFEKEIKNNFQKITF